MPQSQPKDPGVEYTEGPELPKDDESTFSWTPPTHGVDQNKTVQFRPFRLQEDGNDYTKSVRAAYASQVVGVNLGAPGNFDIVLSKASVPAGKISFEATNRDPIALTHEFLLIKTDTSAADLATNAPGGGVFDESSYDIRVDSGDIHQAGNYRVDVTLEAGHYVAVCNEVGHAHSGMATDLTVT